MKAPCVARRHAVHHHARTPRVGASLRNRLKSSASASSSSSSNALNTNDDDDDDDAQISPQTRERLQILFNIDSQGVDTMLSTSEGREVTLSTDSKVLVSQLRVLHEAIPFAKENIGVLLVEAPILLRYDERAIHEALRNIVPSDNKSTSSKDEGSKVNVDVVSCETLCKKCPSAFAHCLRLKLLGVPFKKWELSLREWVESDGDEWAHCFTARPIICSEWGYKKQIENYKRQDLTPWTRKDRDSNRVYSVGRKSVLLTQEDDDDDDDDDAAADE